MAQTLLLKKSGKFYIDIKFDKSIVGPTNIQINGKKYYRFMDYFYLPNLPHKLPRKDVVKLCDLRLIYAEKIIDFPLNKKIIRCMTTSYKNISTNNKKNNLKVLDFGCGSGLSSILLSRNLQKMDLEGIDASPKAVKIAKSSGIKVSLLKANRNFPFPSTYFHVAFAVFVMHFRVGKRDLTELYRVLAPQGMFIYNLYNIDREIIYDALSRAGFSGHNQIACESLPQNHTIHISYKPSTY